MKLTIDTAQQTILQENEGETKVLPLYGRDAFRLLCQQWLRVGWNEKYSYAFSWLGRPIIQLPEDMIRAQEAFYRVKPDVVIETGVAHGGSLVYFASLCKVVGKGRVIGVDIEIRRENRRAIEAHELSPFITLVEGDSTDADVVGHVRQLVDSDEVVMVFLDSSHSRQHVLGELEAYCGLITPGSYIVATDGIMKDLYDTPRGRPEWALDNPAQAALEFAQRHSEFSLEEPERDFNESGLDANVTYWPGAWLRRK
jgi:cephalosporin hydroxylase